MPVFKFNLYREGEFRVAPRITAPDRPSAWCELADYAAGRGIDYDKAVLDSSHEIGPEIVLAQCREIVVEHLKCEGAQDILALISECRQECYAYAAGFANRAVRSLMEEGLVTFENGRYHYNLNG